MRETADNNTVTMAPLFEKKRPQDKNTYSFYLPQDLMKEIDKICKKFNLSRSEVLERLAREGICRHVEEQKSD